jgi:hypothetical protein
MALVFDQIALAEQPGLCDALLDGVVASAVETWGDDIILWWSLMATRIFLQMNGQHYEPLIRTACMPSGH